MRKGKARAVGRTSTRHRRGGGGCEAEGSEPHRPRPRAADITTPYLLRKSKLRQSRRDRRTLTSPATADMVTIGRSLIKKSRQSAMRKNDKDAIQQIPHRPTRDTRRIHKENQRVGARRIGSRQSGGGWWRKQEPRRLGTVTNPIRPTTTRASSPPLEREYTDNRMSRQLLQWLIHLEEERRGLRFSPAPPAAPETKREPPSPPPRHQAPGERDRRAVREG